MLLVDIILIARVIINIRQWNPLFVPYSTGLYMIFALFLTFHTFTLYGERTNAMCWFSTFTYIIESFIIAFCPILTGSEEKQRLIQSGNTLSKLNGIICIMSYTILFIITGLCILFSNQNSSITDTIYIDDTHPFVRSYCSSNDYYTVSFSLMVFSLLYHVMEYISNIKLPSYYFKGIHLIYTIFTALYILANGLFFLIPKTDKTYYIVCCVCDLVLSMLFMCPFLRIVYLY